MASRENALWAFSLAFYARPGVAAACLALQDEAGADVNLSLYLLWCAATRRPLDGAAIAAADRRVADWRASVVEPLRAARRAMKADLLAGVATGDLRERVKAIELESERLVQAALFAAAPAPGAIDDPTEAAAASLALYAAHLGRALPPDPVRTLLDAARN